jgi:hypothetical protein
MICDQEIHQYGANAYRISVTPGALSVWLKRGFPCKLRGSKEVPQVRVYRPAGSKRRYVMTLSIDDAKRQLLVEEVAREAFDRCHANDSFDDMKRRASFSKEDRYLLADWLAFAEAELKKRASKVR